MLAMGLPIEAQPVPGVHERIVASHKVPRTARRRNPTTNSAGALDRRRAGAPASAIDAADEIAPGWRHKAVYLEQFNLRAADLDLLGEEEAAPPDLVNYRTSCQTSFSVHLRYVFQPRGSTKSVA